MKSIPFAKIPAHAPEDVVRYEKHLKSLIWLSSDFYWEQDADFRFTFVLGPEPEKSGIDIARMLGKRRWDGRAIPVAGGGSWAEHQATLAAKQPFSNFLYKRITSRGELRYLSSSGLPMFGEQGEFCGYYGIAKDVTSRIQSDQRLAIEHGVTRILTGAEKIADAAPHILKLVCKTLGWACGTHWELDHRHGTLSCAETWGIDAPGVAEFLAATWRLPPAPVEARGLVRRAVAGKEPVWIPDVTRETTFARAADAARAGFHSAFVFPIHSGEQVLGAMEFFSYEVYQPDIELLRGTSYVASQIEQFCRRAEAERALRDSEQRFRALTDLSSDWYWEQDAEHRFTRFEGRYVARDSSLFEHFLGKTAWEVGLAIEGKGENEAAHRELLESPRPSFGVVMSLRAPDGSRIFLSVNGEPVIDAQGRYLGHRGVSRNITREKQAEQAILRLGRMYAALSATNEAILHAGSPEELFQQVCQAAVEGGKFLATAVLLPDQQGWMHVVAGAGPIVEPLKTARISVDDTRAQGRGLVGSAFRSGKACVCNDFFKDERTRPWHRFAQEEIASVASLPLLQGNRCLGALLFYSNERNCFDDEIVRLLERMVENVSFALENFEREAERKRAEERIQYLATHDGLTGLANRALFSEVLGLAIHSARRYQRSFAVFFLDLDSFKQINDTLGHEAGDRVLQETAQRFSQAIRTSDVVARLGGDEFVALVQEVAAPEQVAAVAGKVLEAITQPIHISGHECRVTASIGIALYPADAGDERSLLKNADAAMYLAKVGGKNSFRFYSPSHSPALTANGAAD